MSAEIDAQKLDLLRKAFPKGLSAGDGGFSESRGTPDAMNAWPQFRSATTQSKAYNSPFFDTAPPTLQQIPRISTHPFQLLQSRNDNGTYSYAVVLESHLFDNLKPNSKISITGLNSPFPLSSGGYVWLGITFDRNSNVTGAFIDNSDLNQFDLSANPWSNNNAYVEDDQDSEEPRHQTSRKLIAYIIADPNGNPIVKQVMNSDQVLRNICINGKPARYPFDHEGGYPF